MNKLQFEAKLASLKRLSTLPAVMSEVIRVCDNPDMTVKELAGIIRNDISLTARMIKAVNSPLYGLPQQVTTVDQAIATMGTRRVKALALSLSVYDLSRGIGKNLDHKDFWRHSLNVACLGELIAQRVEPSLRDEAFIIGCMHDIGVMVLDHFYGDEYVKVCDLTDQGQDILSAERLVLGIDHVTAGEMLVRMWNFPERYCTVIGHHHDIVDLGSSSPDTLLTDIINLADKLATFTVDKHNAIGSDSLANRDILAKNLRLTNAEVKEIEYKSLSNFLKVSGYLEIEVGSPAELLDQAADQLFELYSQTESLYEEVKRFSEKVDEDRLNQAALESLQAIVATFSHYLNNATATISGRTQLIQMALENGEIVDSTGVVERSIDVYQKSAEQITSTIEKLKQMKVFETAIYHENTMIIDLESKLNRIEEELVEMVPQKAE